MRLPLNSRTPIGFALTILFEAAIYVMLCSTVFCAVGIAIGFCVMMMSFGENVERKFKALDENYKINKIKSKIKIELCAVVHLHSTVNELRIIIYVAQHNLNMKMNLTFFINYNLNVSISVKISAICCINC